MKTSLLLLTFTLAVCAQPGRQIASGRNSAGGFGVEYKTYVVPDSPDPSLRLLGTGAAGHGNTVQRVVYDMTSLSYFGYSVTVEPEAAGSVRITFGPVDAARVANLLKGIAGDEPLNAAPPPIFPAPQVVQIGDTVSLDLMVTPDGKHKVVDYLRFSGPMGAPPEPRAAAVTAGARDFTIDDGRVRFPIQGPSELRINGKKYDGTRGATGGEGATFWLSVPAHGRYILSLFPHEGFIKAGAIRDNVIAFQAEGENYELRFAGTIAGSSTKAWNLYLFHDAPYQPGQKMSNGIWMGVGRLDNLLPKR
jgi:hypothetical protein